MLMQRIMRSLHALWLALLLLGSPGTQAQVLQAREVAPAVWFVQGETALGSSANRNFISNAGFVVTPAGVLVIDGLGSPALAEELLAAIRRVTPLPIHSVVVTHYHADHIYGLQALKAAGARILAHPAAREYLHSDTARQRLTVSREELAPWVDEQTRLVPADEWLTGPETELNLGGERLLIRHVGPAHTPEDLVVFHPRSGSLFAGDLVFRGRIPFIGQADSRSWIAALDGLLSLQPARLLPGHGPVADAPQTDLQLTRDYLLHLRQTMGAAARNLEPFDEAYARTDWSRFEALPMFRYANRMNAYNTYLLMEREAP
ncbi:MBL fold metallo-hydrolase [Inhella sp. 1Y17]|uniref:MBL fold metallo-hydrolase n=2 Tax=Inhella proteolytica TaxID=2795029 RepID=A0A931J4L5_9BURK|nr:MBL fold metallo-hydrolase [Inhella proteolytica]